MSTHTYPGVDGASIVVLDGVLVKEFASTGVVLQITKEQKEELQKALSKRSSGRVPGAYPYCSFRDNNRLVAPPKRHPCGVPVAEGRYRVRFAIANRPNRDLYEDYNITERQW